MSAEGWFHLFDLTPPPSKHLDAPGHHELPATDDQKLGFKQHIPANTKVMLISDIGEPSTLVYTTVEGGREFSLNRWEEGHNLIASLLLMTSAILSKPEMES